MTRCKHGDSFYINVDHPTMCIKYCNNCGALKYCYTNMKSRWILSKIYTALLNEEKERVARVKLYNSREIGQ